MMRVLLAVEQVGLRSALRLFLDHELNIVVVGEVGHVCTLPAATASLHPDLILLDWGLAAITTPDARQQLIATVRVVQPQVYILVLTGANEPVYDPLNADAFVSKSEPPERMLAALHYAEAASTSH